MRWQRSIPVLLILLAPGIAPAAPLETAPLESLESRVIREHPRIFLRAGDVPLLKERCRSIPAVQAAYGPLREFAFGNAQHSNLWVAPDELISVLVACVVEDRKAKLLERARRYIEAFLAVDGDPWTRPRILKALAVAYDWIHADLTGDERKKIAARLSYLAGKMRQEYRHSDYNNHVYLQQGPILYAGLALAGDRIDDAFAQGAVLEAEGLLKEHFLPAVNQVGGRGDGGWHESMSYFSFFAYELAHELEAWRTATGEDLFPSCPGLRGAPAWLLHSTRPHDGSLAPVADIDTPAPWGWQEAEYLQLLAARYQDGLAQRAASLVAPASLAAPEPACRGWPQVLWFDPAVEPAPLDSQPPGMLFRGVGWAAMRSRWEKDAAWALFICGDHYSGHQHSDQNSFVISLKGDLAIDAGEYGAKETSFHNTVLIGDGQRVHGNDPQALLRPHGGGQRV